VVLTLDVGTSSVRAMLHDVRAREVPGAEARVEYRPRVAADGTAEMDAARLIRICTTAIGGVARMLRRNDEVLAVGFSSFWHGLLGLDRRGRPSLPLILWSDTRGWREARRLGDELDGEAVRHRTGAPLHPSYWPAKLAWVRRTMPQAWRDTARWVSFADLLYEELLGEAGTSVSMASGTGLRRLADGAWDAELLAALDLDPRRLPGTAEEASGLRPAYAGHWRALARVPWLTARGDGALANLGSDCVDESRRALTVGTSAALRVTTARRPERLAPGLWCYLIDAGRYLVGGSFSNGGNLHEWLLRTLRVDDRRLQRHLRRLPLASEDVAFLPLLSGERSPGFAPHAYGAVARITQATSAEDIARAGLEAVAMRIALVDAALDETAPGAERLLASGGALGGSPAWCQVMADAIGKPLSTLGVDEASSRGAALIALARAEAPSPRKIAVKRTFRPRPDAHAAHRRAYGRVETLYSTLIAGRLLDG
jgi:gluconokinase